MNEKQINVNLNIQEGDAFFAHEMALNFNPLQFNFDFKSITPRIDNRNQDGSVFFNLKHNVIQIEPWHAKEIAKILTQSIEQYEKAYGKIEKPKAMQIFEKNKPKIAQDSSKASYFG